MDLVINYIFADVQIFLLHIATFCEITTLQKIPIILGSFGGMGKVALNVTTLLLLVISL